MPGIDRYASPHANPTGPGDARPTAQQIIDDEGLRGKLRDKTILITGCSSGIGIETARALATTGARLYMTVRDLKKGNIAMQDIVKSDVSLDPSRLELIHMDQKSLQSVRDAVSVFQSKSEQLNVLINNAGIGVVPEGTTEDGFETHFGVNHLSHFLLFQLLKPTLLASSTPSFPSRVINVASLVHRLGSVCLGDYNFLAAGYDPLKGYAQSKTCNIWMSNEIERRYGSQGLHSLSLHPGGILTGLQAGHVESFQKQVEAMLQMEEIAKHFKSPEQGSATTVLAAVGQAFHEKGGLYLEDCAEGFPTPEGARMWEAGYAPWAFNEAGEKRLWADSLAFVNLTEEYGES